MDRADSADDAYARVGGYTAAEAAHTFQEYLEGHLSLRAFAQWLDAYRPGRGGTPRDTEVEDELNTALLAVRALQQGKRPRQDVDRDLQGARGRLTGLARQ